jgi:hypothetical protein
VLSRDLKKNPVLIAEELAPLLSQQDLIEESTAT